MWIIYFLSYYNIFKLVLIITLLVLEPFSISAAEEEM